MALSICSPKSLVLLFLASAIPIAYIISQETAAPSTHVYRYHSLGFFHESAKWDGHGRRFLVSSLDGSIAEIRVPDEDGSPAASVLEEVTVVRDADYAGNASLGIVVDRRRDRLLVVVADLLGRRYGALAAYDLSSWKRLFLTQLAGPSDEKSFADDVAVDAEGNAYVTDASGSKIWKVGVDGKLLSTIASPLFSPQEWYKKLLGLNGIVYHPDGYLLVIHTLTGDLYKIDISKGDDVISKVKIAEGPLSMGDGLELLSPMKLVVASGRPSARLVESSDRWETASIAGKFWGPSHRVATAVTVKDGKAYLNHLLGMGLIPLWRLFFQVDHDIRYMRDVISIQSKNNKRIHSIKIKPNQTNPINSI